MIALTFEEIILAMEFESSVQNARRSINVEQLTDAISRGDLSGALGLAEANLDRVPSLVVPLMVEDEDA